MKTQMQIYVSSSLCLSVTEILTEVIFRTSRNFAQRCRVLKGTFSPWPLLLTAVLLLTVQGQARDAYLSLIWYNFRLFSKDKLAEDAIPK